MKKWAGTDILELNPDDFVAVLRTEFITGMQVPVDVYLKLSDTRFVVVLKEGDKVQFEQSKFAESFKYTIIQTIKNMSQAKRPMPFCKGVLVLVVFETTLAIWPISVSLPVPYTTAVAYPCTTTLPA